MQTPSSHKKKLRFLVREHEKGKLSQVSEKHLQIFALEKQKKCIHKTEDGGEKHISLIFFV